MFIQSSPAVYASTAIATPHLTRQETPPAPAIAAETAGAGKVEISAAARALLAAEQAAGQSGAKTLVDSSHGQVELDFDRYFTPPGENGVRLDDTPLLLPTQRNIDALSAHISARMPAFLAEHNIPAPPASITYDHAGKMVLPADYPHAAAFREALEAEPQLERQLRTTAALSSMQAALEESIAFQEEYAAAGSAAEIAAVINRHRHLFSNFRVDQQQSALYFSASGELRTNSENS